MEWLAPTACPETTRLAKWGGLSGPAAAGFIPRMPLLIPQRARTRRVKLKPPGEDSIRATLATHQALPTNSYILRA
eukprot:1280473-Alexandrium_andersonii.AAC.1